MSEVKTWKYSLGKECHPMHDIRLDAKTYHEAAREVAYLEDNGEEPQEIREVWLLSEGHDTPRWFEVHAELRVNYDAYEITKGSGG